MDSFRLFPFSSIVDYVRMCILTGNEYTARTVMAVENSNERISKFRFGDRDRFGNWENSLTV